MDLTDPVATALLAAEAFERAGVRHALFGGLALAAFGEPRETRDADFAVVEGGTSAAAHALGAVGFSCAVAFERVVFGGLVVGRVTLLGGPGHTGLNVIDLVQPRSRRFAVSSIDRAPTSMLRGVRIRIVTPEDFIALKVLATRDRDLDDAASVLRRSPELIDVPAIDAECAALATEVPDHDVLARWAEVRRRAAADPLGRPPEPAGGPDRPRC